MEFISFENYAENAESGLAHSVIKVHELLDTIVIAASGTARERTMPQIAMNARYWLPDFAKRSQCVFILTDDTRRGAHERELEPPTRVCPGNEGAACMAVQVPERAQPKGRVVAAVVLEA